MFQSRGISNRLALGLIAVALFATLAPQSATADDSFALNRPALPPSSAENRIIKWCADVGTHVRYASANIQLKNYSPCGEVKTAMSCDAVGNRMISPGGDVPYGHRDCSLGKRLVVIRHDPVEPTSPTGGLSSNEQHALNREFKQLQRDQEKQEAKQIEAAMRGFAGMFFNDKSTRQQRRSSQIRSSQRPSKTQQIDVAQLLKLISAP